VLRLTRVYDAPRALVFKVWVQPEHIVRWWGPRGYSLASCKMDPRPGGAYRFCMRHESGKDLWLHGVYNDVAPPERVAFTFVWEDAEGKPGHETLVTVTFADEGGKTRLTLNQEIFETVESRDSHEGGWSESLDMLAEYLAEAVRG
jgi:uncharacterized protein YndB with AHSA1/START domain